MPASTTLTSLMSAAVAKKALDGFAVDMYDLGKERFGAAWGFWNATANREVLHRQLRRVRFVKTVWQFEKEVDLAKFYCPSRIKTSSGTKELRDATDFPDDTNVVVQGTVGQGKSILFRYLTAREVSLGKRLPLFIELRRLAPQQQLMAHLLSECQTLGLNLSEDSLRFLADQGRLVLFLDAFDEVAEPDRASLITEIENLIRRHERLRIYVTSRPDSGIANSPFFRVIDLAPLRGRDYENVVRRIVHQPATATAIIAGVNANGEAVRSLLTTPLMVALLVFRYRAQNSIPQNIIAFYDQLFALLLQRHDKSKAGYVRPRTSGLADSTLERIFEALSFITRRESLGAFSMRELITLVERSCHVVGASVAPDLVANDIIKITCLIQEEGGECRFIHRSVQEFHAARFIAQRPDRDVLTFYNTASHKGLAWVQELRFLELLDDYRFKKYFLIPCLERTLKISASSGPRVELADLLGPVIPEVTLYVASGTSPRKGCIERVGHPVADYPFYVINDALVRSLFKVAINTRGCTVRSAEMSGETYQSVSLSDVWNQIAGQPVVQQNLTAAYEQLVHAYKDAVATCQRAEADPDLFSV